MAARVPWQYQTKSISGLCKIHTLIGVGPWSAPITSWIAYRPPHMTQLSCQMQLAHMPAGFNSLRREL